jgi:hypothetical protein
MLRLVRHVEHGGNKEYYYDSLENSSPIRRLENNVIRGFRK